MPIIISLNISILIISSFIIFLLFFFSKNNDYLVENPSREIRKIHKRQMIKIGGISFASLILLNIFIDNYQLILILFFSLAFLIIGILSDMIIKFGYYTRLLLFIVFITIYLIVSNNYISNLEFILLNSILQVTFFSYLFSLLAYLLLINGTNIIDGLHGLKTGSMIIILIFFIYHLPLNQTELIIFLTCIVSASFPLFLINFFISNIRSGDAGSYYLGFIVGSVAIYINILGLMNPYHIACILSYPIIEIVFSYFRRIANKKNPFKPDNLHLHTLFFYFINTKLSQNFINIENSNRLASTILLLLQIIFNFLIIFFAAKTSDYIYFIGFIFINYLLAYYSLHQYKSNNGK
mgnify:CR=1 FL=1